MKRYNRPSISWGKSLWDFIHTICVVDFEYPEDNIRIGRLAVKCLTNITEIIPCNTCSDEWKQSLEEINSFDLSKSMILFDWSWRVHNNINQRLQKPLITYDDALNNYVKYV